MIQQMQSIQQNYSFLDKLVYVPPKKFGEDANLNKRARSKIWTQAINRHLMQLDSPLNKMYKRAYYCADGVIQEGTKVRSKYCNSRSCNVCNRIRTGKMMRGYMPQMIGQQYFVTLTIPNVPADKLRDTIKEMQKNCTNIIRNLREKKKLNPDGIRKIEVTYSEERGDYHPHFHILLNCEESAHLLLIKWLNKYPKAKLKAQHITEADQKSLNELFKYTTKMGERVSGTQELYLNIKALDVILVATKGIRTFQPFGNIRKVKSEEITAEDIQTQHYNIPFVESAFYLWCGHDWIDVVTRQPLTYTQKPIFKVIDISKEKPPLGQPHIIKNDFEYEGKYKSNNVLKLYFNTTLENEI